ncbi:unnamed protein product [Phytophthora lilii]|uniref:Unnamed protein product n=1 Tax=Phytophthora lilii TaxID=2077276 RepID=A0A9W6X5N6_9STRA|nr:unnamed protein product [Phytophthora lilii]
MRIAVDTVAADAGDTASSALAFEEAMAALHDVAAHAGREGSPLSLANHLLKIVFVDDFYKRTSVDMDIRFLDI